MSYRRRARIARVTSSRKANSWSALVLGIILNHGSIKKNIADFLKGDVLFDHLLVRMRSDAYGIGLNLLAKAVFNGAVILNIFSVHCP
jgi:hypothetical protein